MLKTGLIIALLLIAPAVKSAHDDSAVLEVVNKILEASVIVIGPRGAQGSGVIIGERLVVTSGHVAINPEGRYILSSKDGAFQAMALTRKLENGSDYAQLVPAGFIAAPVEVRCTPPAIGERVIVVGSPGGVFNVVTFGYVSSIVDDMIPDTRQIILIDVATGPGGSGGGVFDLDGRLLAISTALRSLTEIGPTFLLATPISQMGEGEFALCI